MKKIYLNGKDAEKYALVDDCDFNRLSKHKWYLNSGGYAFTVKHVPGKKKGSKARSKNLAMHRMLVECPPGKVIDHINRDRLDNRRSNLRATTYAVNSWNTERWHMGYLGVSLAEKYGTRYRVRVGGLQYGQYANPKTAAMVYDEVVRQTRGPDYQLNFPDEHLPPDFEIPNLNVAPQMAEKQSREVGVSWFKPQQRWRFIHKRKTIGYAETEAEAIELKRRYLQTLRRR